MRTNPYHDHSEREDVRFPRDRTTSPEYFWRRPSGDVSVFVFCRIHSANDRRKLEIGQTSMAVVTDENSRLTKGY